MKQLHWTKPILSELSELVDSDGRAYASVSARGGMFGDGPLSVLGFKMQEGKPVLCVEWSPPSEVATAKLVSKIMTLRSILRNSVADDASWAELMRMLGGE